MLRKVLQRVRGNVRNLCKYNDITWRYTFNLNAVVNYRLEKKAPLLPEAARVLADLNEHGVAVSSVEDLFPDGKGYAELSAAVARREQELAEELDKQRKCADDPQMVGTKPYLLALLGEPKLDADSIWARFALQPTVVDIANAYYGLQSNLAAYNVWHNFGTQAPARASQLWHRDPEDRYILKIFVYLTDVKEGNGPFTYACGTHPKGKHQTQPEYLFKERETTRSDDTQMAAVVPEAEWKVCTGRAGTVIFADTRGYHKGGLVRESDRIMYVGEFLSPAAGLGGIVTKRTKREPVACSF